MFASGERSKRLVNHVGGPIGGLIGDEASKANVRLGQSPPESGGYTEANLRAAQTLKIEEAAEKAKVTKRTGPCRMPFTSRTRARPN
jgi:hypothetical protein